MEARSSPRRKPTTLSQAFAPRRDRDSASVGLCVRAFFTLPPHQLVFPGARGPGGEGGRGGVGAPGRPEGS